MALRGRRFRRWTALLPGLLVVLLFLLLLRPAAPPWRQDVHDKAPLRRELPLSSPTPVTTTTGPQRFPADAPEIRVGLLLKNIYNLQLDSQTFSAAGWYWLEWDEAVNSILRTHNLGAEQMVEFANQVEAWDSQIEAETADPQRTAQGKYYQLFRFSARFYIDTIDERHSPFETVVLPVVVETRPQQFALSSSAVRLRADSSLGSLTGDYSELAGYSLRRNWVVEGENHYDLLGPDSDEVYSQIGFRVAYGSEPWAAFTKWILPLMIVMSIVLLAPSLESSLGEIRLAIPSTALLTLVFLQQTYKSELPSTPYLTFLDELYAYSYLVAVGLFALFLWGSNRMESASEDQREAVRQGINRMDTVCQWGALLGFVVVALLAWFL